MRKKTGVTNRRYMIAKNLTIMLVLFVVVFIAVFAWYYVKRDVSASGITVSASVPDEVEIAPEIYETVNNTKVAKIGTWGGSLAINNSVNKFKFSTDVSSDGEKFIIPAFSTTENNSEAMKEATKNGKIVNPDGIPTIAKNNLSLSQEEIDDGITGDYYTLPFYIKSKKKSIVVKPNAYLAMAAEKGIADANGNTAIRGASSARKSVYGNFTSDAIVSAMRVSIVGKPVESISNSTPTMLDVDSKCNFLWNPRPDIFLIIPDNTTGTDWDLPTAPVTESSSLARLGESVASGTTYTHNYYEPVSDGINMTGSKLTTVNDNRYYTSDWTKPVNDGTVGNYTVPTLGVSAGLIPQNYKKNQSVVPYSVIDGYYVYRFELNLWIEGTDTEARRAMDTGQFKMFLEFGND